MNYNEKLRSIRIREAIVFLIVGMIVTGIITRVTSLDAIQGFGENLLIFIVFLGFIYMLRGTTGFADSIGSAFEHKNEIIYLFVINFLFGFFLVAFITFFDPSGFDTSALSKEYTGVGFLFNVLSSVILAPVVEELLFRGVLFNRLNEKMSLILAMLISSLLFGLFHGFGVTQFVFGLCMCVVYLKTRNIMVPIIIHIMSNLFAVIFADILHVESFIFQMPMLAAILVVSAVCGILVLLYTYRGVKALEGL